MNKKTTDRETFLREIAEINKVRKELGLSLVEYGNLDCLKCDKEFFSYDVKNNKMCYQCKEGFKRV